MKIAIGCDHAGFQLKEQIKSFLSDRKELEVKDVGTYSEERADYPDFAHAVSIAIENKEADFGILICGSGNGINITANKHQGIRAALCWTEEVAALARQHNNAKKCVNAFLTAQFEGGRHADRINKIPNINC